MQPCPALIQVTSVVRIVLLHALALDRGQEFLLGSLIGRELLVPDIRVVRGVNDLEYPGGLLFAAINQDIDSDAVALELTALGGLD